MWICCECELLPQVVGPSCLSLLMVQGTRLFSRCWKQRLVGWLVVVLAVVVYTEHFEMLIPEWIFTKSNRATTMCNNDRANNEWDPNDSRRRQLVELAQRQHKLQDTKTTTTTRDNVRQRQTPARWRLSHENKQYLYNNKQVLFRATCQTTTKTQLLTNPQKKTDNATKTHANASGYLFWIFCVVLKNTDCCLFKFIFFCRQMHKPHVL